MVYDPRGRGRGARGGGRGTLCLCVGRGPSLSPERSALLKSVRLCLLFFAAAVNSGPGATRAHTRGGSACRT